jgi:hypothetical protein
MPVFSHTFYESSRADPAILDIFLLKKMNSHLPQPALIGQTIRRLQAKNTTHVLK